MTSSPPIDLKSKEDPQVELSEILFRSMGIDGVHARTALYEDMLARLDELITEHREDGTETLRFPPVMSRNDLERHGYLKSFPNLVSCACALHGSEAKIREAASRSNNGWVSDLQATDLVLSPAACYPIYPIVAARGAVPADGLLFDVAAECFRREPSRDLDRLQSFRMREYVCFGTAEQVGAFRERWIVRACEIASMLSLPHSIAQASDPFFGRTGQIMAAAQLQMALKFELIVPLHSAERPTACMSFNNHKDHFGSIWGLAHQGDVPVHTACVAFGMDRLTLALFWTHGTKVAQWPGNVKRILGI